MISSFSIQEIILLISTGVIVLWLIVLSFFIFRLYSWHKKLFGDTKKENLKEVLQEHIERVGVVQIKLNDVETMVREIQKDGMKHIQRVGVVRFNPFGDTGGDQSFVIAILDDNNDGLVVSSLHGRERTRMYAKPVKQGKEDEYPFSDEEKEAIRQAQR